MPPLASSPVPASSPCIDICELQGEVCRGCGRSLDEIAAWGMLSEAQRRKIMSELPARIRAMGAMAEAPEEAIAHIEAVLNETG